MKPRRSLATPNVPNAQFEWFGVRRSSDQDQPLNQRGFFLWLLAASLLLALACQQEEPLPQLWPAPAFTLRDQQGRPFGSAELAGRAVLVNFVYTRCPDICPLLTATMAQVQKQLQAEGLLGSKVQLLSVSVDPDHDTPAVLSEYAAQYQAAPEHWRFLTGDRGAVYDVLAGFKVNTREVALASAGAAVVPHSNRFVVIDSEGMVRATLPGDEAFPEDIVRALKKALTS